MTSTQTVCATLSGTPMGATFTEKVADKENHVKVRSQEPGFQIWLAAPQLQWTVQTHKNIKKNTYKYCPTAFIWFVTQ